MATYKVAQDVEADDKLIGPFSFRQFIYLIIVVISIGLAWGLGKVFIGLAIIPTPLIIFFGALALPLKKDQPMEVYLAAVLSFYLKPRKRLWKPDGIDSLVEVTAPKVVENHRIKDLSGSEAERRLSYLADIADTEGWAVRHIAKPFMNNSGMIDDAYNAAQQTPDILDDTGAVAQAIDTRITQSTVQRRQMAVARMQQAAQDAQVPQPQQTPTQPVPAPQLAPTPVVAPTPQPAPAPQLAQTPQPFIADPYQSFIANMQQQPAAVEQTEPTNQRVQYNPYPDSIRQSVIQPLDPNAPPVTQQPMSYQPPVQPLRSMPVQNQPPISAESTSEIPVSPDIINLANNSDLSIETIQHEANRRINKKSKIDDDEVFIPLH